MLRAAATLTTCTVLALAVSMGLVHAILNEPQPPLARHSAGVQRAVLVGSPGPAAVLARRSAPADGGSAACPFLNQATVSSCPFLDRGAGSATAEIRCPYLGSNHKSIKPGPPTPPASVCPFAGASRGVAKPLPTRLLRAAVDTEPRRLELG